MRSNKAARVDRQDRIDELAKEKVRELEAQIAEAAENEQAPIKIAELESQISDIKRVSNLMKSPLNDDEKKEMAGHISQSMQAEIERIKYPRRKELVIMLMEAIEASYHEESRKIEQRRSKAELEIKEQNLVRVKEQEELGKVSKSFAEDHQRLGEFLSKLRTQHFETIIGIENTAQIFDLVPVIFKSFEAFSKEDVILPEKKTSDEPRKGIQDKLDLFDELIRTFPERKETYLENRKAIKALSDKFSDKVLTLDEYKEHFEKKWNTEPLKAELDLIKQFKQTQALYAAYVKFTSVQNANISSQLQTNQLRTLLDSSPTLKSMVQASRELDNVVSKLQFVDKQLNDFLKRHPDFGELICRAKANSLIQQAETSLNSKGKEYLDTYDKNLIKEMHKKTDEFLKGSHPGLSVYAYIEKLQKKDIPELHEKIKERHKAKRRIRDDLAAFADKIEEHYKDLIILESNDQSLKDKKQQHTDEYNKFSPNARSLEDLTAYRDKMKEQSEQLEKEINQKFKSKIENASDMIDKLKPYSTLDKSIDRESALKSLVKKTPFNLSEFASYTNYLQELAERVQKVETIINVTKAHQGEQVISKMKMEVLGPMVEEGNKAALDTFISKNEHVIDEVIAPKIKKAEAIMRVLISKKEPSLQDDLKKEGDKLLKTWKDTKNINELDRFIEENKKHLPLSSSGTESRIMPVVTHEHKDPKSGFRR